MADDENLSPEQTEKLVQFQEITHIDSIEECKQLLEAFQWNVELAVQNTFENHPQETTTSQPRPQSRTEIPNINIDTQATSFPRREQAVAPRGIVEWAVSLIQLPFRFIFRTLLDLISFFMSFLEDNSIPDNYDPLENVNEFTNNYNEKFGTNHPEFFAGSYNQALELAKQELRFLVVYIHQNDNTKCLKFANETLSNQDLIDYFRNKNLIFWACSKNLPEGRKAFKSLKASRCPSLAVLVPKRSKMTIVRKVEVPKPASDLLNELRQSITTEEPELIVRRHEREERNQTQQIRQEQDQAFLESLRIDREKAKKKQDEEEAARKAEELERLKQEEENANQNRKLERKAELRRLFAETLEPDASNQHSIKLGFKFPSGTRLSRIFLKTDSVCELYKFVFSNEECPLNFEMRTFHPNIEIKCNEETTISIQEFGIDKPMLIYVNDLDA
ncbi:unnamed protein product [Brachionus calyciflorus]|uniref:UBX domain-containing protein n=1 Tax=Brachionus calyciflorus TaxID=104777 RepID=A0A813M0R7_9BILA|nr:unnamed protein product [Brachionus calyciflorus]